jgi:hypothetical protein
MSSAFSTIFSIGAGLVSAMPVVQAAITDLTDADLTNDYAAGQSLADKAGDIVARALPDDLEVSQELVDLAVDGVGKVMVFVWAIANRDLDLDGVPDAREVRVTGARTVAEQMAHKALGIS